MEAMLISQSKNHFLQMWIFGIKKKDLCENFRKYTQLYIIL